MTEELYEICTHCDGVGTIDITGPADNIDTTEWDCNKCGGKGYIPYVKPKVLPEKVSILFMYYNNNIINIAVFSRTDLAQKARDRFIARMNEMTEIGYEEDLVFTTEIKRLKLDTFLVDDP